MLITVQNQSFRVYGMLIVKIVDRMLVDNSLIKGNSLWRVKKITKNIISCVSMGNHFEQAHIRLFN